MQSGEAVVIHNRFGQFEEIALICSDILGRRGYVIHRVDFPDTNDNRLHILFGANVWEDVAPLPKHYIIFQLEQHPIKRWFIPAYFARLQNAVAVWDYNLGNIEFLRTKGIDAIHVPLGYAPIFISPQLILETIDVLFLGLLRNAHREQVLQALRDAGLKVVAQNNVFGDQKKQLVAQSKVVLNIHYGFSAILEEARLIPLLSAGKVVVSETVKDSRYLNLYKDYVVFTETTEELVEKCRDWVSKDSLDRRLWGQRVSHWVQTERDAYHLSPWREMEVKVPDLPYFSEIRDIPLDCLEALIPKSLHRDLQGWQIQRHFRDRSWIKKVKD